MLVLGIDIGRRRIVGAVRADVPGRLTSRVVEGRTPGTTVHSNRKNKGDQPATVLRDLWTEKDAQQDAGGVSRHTCPKIRPGLYRARFPRYKNYKITVSVLLAGSEQ